jgi:hypothetical protein
MEVRPAVDVAPVRQEYEAVAALKTPAAREAYVTGYLDARGGRSEPPTGEIAGIIAGLDARGAWVTDTVRVHQAEHTPMHSGNTTPMRGIATGVFVRNLSALAAYVAGLAK